MNIVAFQIDQLLHFLILISILKHILILINFIVNPPQLSFLHPFIKMQQTNQLQFRDLIRFLYLFPINLLIQ